MKKHCLCCFIIGVLTMALIAGLVSAVRARPEQKTAGADIYVNGVKISSADGMTANAFIYNGVVYVPLRPDGRPLGWGTYRDGDTYRSCINAPRR